MVLRRCCKCCNERNISDLYVCCKEKQRLCVECVQKYRCTVCRNYYPIKEIPNHSSHRCKKCTLMLSNCQCSNKKKQAIQECDKCQNDFDIDFMFCNPTCGHYFCMNCTKNKRDRCSCQELLDYEAVKKYLMKCCACDNIMLNKKNYSQIEDMAICEGCNKGNQELESQISQNNSSNKKQTLQEDFKQSYQEKELSFDLNPLIVSDKQENRKDQSEQQDKREKFEQVKSPAEKEKQNGKKIQERQEKQEKKEQQVGKNYQKMSNMHIEEKYIRKDNEKNQAPQKPIEAFNVSCTPQAQQNKPNTKTPTQSLESSRLSKLSNCCSLCNISYQSLHLFRNPACSKNHGICKLCLYIKRRDNIDKCIECQIQNQQMLARKLNYQQLNGLQRQQYISSFPDNLTMCSLCSIMLPKQKVYGHQHYCLICISK